LKALYLKSQGIIIFRHPRIPDNATLETLAAFSKRIGKHKYFNGLTADVSNVKSLVQAYCNSQ
jgi:hypothetical protein